LKKEKIKKKAKTKNTYKEELKDKDFELSPESKVTSQLIKAKETSMNGIETKTFLPEDEIKIKKLSSSKIILPKLKVKLPKLDTTNKK